MDSRMWILEIIYARQLQYFLATLENFEKHSLTFQKPIGLLGPEVSVAISSNYLEFGTLHLQDGCVLERCL